MDPPALQRIARLYQRQQRIRLDVHLLVLSPLLAPESLGFFSRRLSDLFCGMQKDAFARWKHLRKTTHTHHPVDDAKGNAEILLMMKKEMGLKIKL